ncbi:MAG: single-stranded DNA-binding protein [Microbacteriaceae bacterium]|nr:single-stranded DNA-binding protein [Microbacteriaceae bacterium]
MNEPQITVVGNLASDPDLRTSNSGNPWVTFTVAATPRVRDRQTGNWADGETLWVRCRAFGEYAENIANSLKKGMRVLVEGKLSQSRYTDKDGLERTSLELDVNEVGPSLRFATAQVVRSASRGQVGQFGAPDSGFGQQGGYGAQAAQGQSAWATAPASPATQPVQPAKAAPAGSPWGVAGDANDSDFSDETAF